MVVRSSTIKRVFPTGHRIPVSIATFSVNLGIFYITWFICVVWRMPWAVAAAAVAIAFHLVWVRPGVGEWRVLIACSAVGIVVDSLLTLTGVFNFQTVVGGDVFGETLAPLWLMALWLVFATTLNVSMKPLSNKLMLAGPLGAIMGPLSYWLGLKLNAVSFPLGVPITLSLLALIWAILLPVLLGIANRLGTANSTYGPP